MALGRRVLDHCPPERSRASDPRVLSDGWRVRLDLVWQVVGLEVPDRATIACTRPCRPRPRGRSRLVERLLDEATAASREELGSAGPGVASAAPFADWRSGLMADLDLDRDVRTMVPVVYDGRRRRTIAWVVLRWRTVSVDVWYERPAAVLDVGRFSLEAAGPEHMTG